MGKTAGKPGVRSAMFICACFLLTSTGYLAWVYHIMEMVPSRTADAVSMVAGYALQAAGLGLFMALLRRRGGFTRRLFRFTLVLHMLCLIPAVRSASLFRTLVFGGLLNLQCGMIAGCYLYALTSWTEEKNSAITLGTGYGVSIFLTWLLSVAGRGSAFYSRGIPGVCLVLTALAFFSAFPHSEPGAEAAPDLLSGRRPAVPEQGFIFSAGVLILLFSIVNSCGFGFPSADLGRGVSLEFSRLFYAGGLLIAGSVNDRSRKYGSVCALAALVIPFIMLALKGEPVPLRIFWALSYFTFGFYSIYRMILFSDLARRSGLTYLCCFGLLTGRVGDAAGEALCLTLTDRIPLLIGITAVLFVLCVFLFFRVYPVLYPEQAPAQALLQIPGAGGEEGGAGPCRPGPGDPERQEPERQEPGRQDPDRQEPDRQEPDGQEPGGQEPGAADDAGGEMPEIPAGTGRQIAGAAGDAGRKVPDAPGSGTPSDPPFDPMRDHDLEPEETAGRGPDQERERFYRFSARYSLSAREREVLRQLLEEKTNKEIAETLSISEGTVKYHIHNLLQKTGCRNRGVLLSVFFVGRDHVGAYSAGEKTEKKQ